MNRKLLVVIGQVALLIALTYLMVYPIAWMVASSLKANNAIFTDALSLLPRPLDLSNYPNGWRGFAGISFGVFFKNSFVIAALSTIGAVSSSAMVAYGFQRVRFTGRRFLFVCLMVTLMLPEQVLMVPQYVIFAKLGWINTVLPLVVPSYLGSAFFIFLIMQFIGSIPAELDESAFLDGCGKGRIFVSIMIPLLKPALVTVAIFSFYWKWNDFMGPLLYLNTPSKYPASIALSLFSDPSTMTDWGSLFAMSTLSLLPIIAIYFLFQRHITEGISTTGLKG